MKQRAKVEQKPAEIMFPECDDLPLFSGTSQRVDDLPFNPQPRPVPAPQLVLPGFEDVEKAPHEH